MDGAEVGRRIPGVGGRPGALGGRTEALGGRTPALGGRARAGRMSDGGVEGQEVGGKYSTLVE